MKYFIKWKGDESGPFTPEQMKEMFETGRVGMLHQVRSEGEGAWVPFKEFLASNPFENVGKEKRCERDRLSAMLPYFTYGLCGASFLSIYIYLALVAFSLYLASMGNRRFAAVALALGTVMVALGYAFFNVVVPVLMD